MRLSRHKGTFVGVRDHRDHSAPDISELEVLDWGGVFVFGGGVVGYQEAQRVLTVIHEVQTIIHGVDGDWESEGLVDQDLFGEIDSAQEDKGILGGIDRVEFQLVRVHKLYQDTLGAVKVRNVLHLAVQAVDKLPIEVLRISHLKEVQLVANDQDHIVRQADTVVYGDVHTFKEGGDGDLEGHIVPFSDDELGWGCLYGQVLVGTEVESLLCLLKQLVEWTVYNAYLVGRRLYLHEGCSSNGTCQNDKGRLQGADDLATLKVDIVSAGHHLFQIRLVRVVLHPCSLPSHPVDLVKLQDAAKHVLMVHCLNNSLSTISHNGGLDLALRSPQQIQRVAATYAVEQLSLGNNQVGPLNTRHQLFQLE